MSNTISTINPATGETIATYEVVEVVRRRARSRRRPCRRDRLGIDTAPGPRRGSNPSC